MTQTPETTYSRWCKSQAAGASDPLAAGRAVYKQLPVTVEAMDDRRVRFTITTNNPDRERDVVDATGVDTANFEANPVVLFGHDYKSLPIGRCVSIERYRDKIVAVAEFATADLNPMAEQVYRMVKAGFLKATSIGFRPLEWSYDELRKGVDFLKSELLEFSIVPVPANAQALISMGHAGIDVAVLKDWATLTLGDILIVEQAAAQPDELVPGLAKADLRFDDADPVRWNRSLSKTFDVDGEPLEAGNIEYAWASRFLASPVKDLYETTVHVPGARMGSYLMALNDSLARYKTESVRNIATRSEKEVPPVYETIQLNSTLSQSFLVEGLRFVSGAAKMVVKVQPSWSGIAVTLYIARAGAQHAVDFLARTGHQSRQYKFLKGEAFALSGEFIARDGTTGFGSVFLDEKNIGPVRRIAALVNEQGGDVECRGLIAMGPPGTGKTLIMRAMMNEVKDATYIWCTARDFYRTGSFGGIELAFDLARENAPSIILFEDVDDAIGQCTDLLKAELDGVVSHKGVVTVITTNFPEMLPKALIDRPGRFHDILQFDLPSEGLRRTMLDAWAPDAPAEVRAELAKSTSGFSGAHLRELVRFATTIKSQDGVDLSAALRQALEKVKSQRALIDALHSGQTNRWREVSPLKKSELGRITAEGVIRLDIPRLVPALFKGGLGTCDRCGKDSQALCVGVCAPCVNDLHPVNDQAAEVRVAQLARIGAVARGVMLVAPFERDPVGWKAFVRAREKAERKSGAGLTDAALAELLDAYGFEAEAKDVEGEEAAELVGYQTLASLLVQAASSVSDALVHVGALVAAETEAPTETPEGEAAEATVESARLAAVCALSAQAVGTLQSVGSLATAMAACEERPYAAADTTLMGARLRVAKAGRVLSKLNEEKLSEARDAARSVADRIDAVLASAARPAEDEEGDGGQHMALVLVDSDGSSADIVLDVDDAVERAEDGEQRFDIDPDLMAQAIASQLKELVERESRKAINALRGIVD